MRVSNRPALERILAIDLAIRGGKWPNSRTLARRLDVASRTIQRDIEFMRDRLHAPIEFDIGRREVASGEWRVRTEWPVSSGQWPVGIRADAVFRSRSS